MCGVLQRKREGGIKDNMRWVSYVRLNLKENNSEMRKEAMTENNAAIHSFMKSHGWKVEKRYSDKKYGENVQDKFLELVEDGMKRKFDGVVVNSFSQCGKNVWVAIDVLYKTFYPAGIAFAVVEDDFISMDHSPEEVEEYIQSKRRDMFADMTQKRERDVALSGLLTPRHEKYGFRLSEDRRALEIDKAAAKVVGEIFQMFLSGKCFAEIAHCLQEQQIISPQEHKVIARGKVPQVIVPGKWYGSSIKRILMDSIYTGRNADGIEFPYEVPAIVSEKDFEKVQSMIKKQTTPQKNCQEKMSHVLNKRIYDKVSGSPMCCRKYPEENGVPVYTVGKKRLGKECENRIDYVSVEEIMASIVTSLRDTSKKATYIDCLMESEECNRYREEALAPIRREAAMLFEEIHKEYIQRMQVHQCYEDGELDEQTLIKAEENGRQQFEKQEERFQQLMVQESEICKAYSRTNPWIVRYRDLDVPDELNREQVRRWLRIVKVQDFQVVEIELLDSKWMDMLPQRWLQHGKEG